MTFEVRRINIDVIVRPRRSINPFISLSTKKMGYIAYSFQPVAGSGQANHRKNLSIGKSHCRPHGQLPVVIARPHDRFTTFRSAIQSKRRVVEQGA